MNGLYLKAVEQTDINILRDYNNSFKKFNLNGWVSEDRFINLLKDKFYCMVKRSFYRNFLKTLFNDKYRYIYILS